MIEFTVSDDFVKRIRRYISSEEYNKIPSYAKSEYWKYHSDAVDIVITDNKVSVDGKSGFYIPERINGSGPEKGFIGNIGSETRRLSQVPTRLLSRVKQKLKPQTHEIKLLDYYTAFDKLMDSELITDPDMSPYRIDFEKLRKDKRVVSSIADMSQKFFAKDKFTLTPHVVRGYHYQNILLPYLDPMKVKVALDIGTGSGILPSILHTSLGGLKTIIVDLPNVLCFSMLFIHELFPEARVLMPHECGDCKGDYDFIFLTPDQINRIEDNAVDIALNTASFQEMTHKQIEEYFKLIQRCCRDKAVFFTANRVDKVPRGIDCHKKRYIEPPNRFSEYPWHPANTIMIYEVCRLTRLTQLDNVYIRLERINK